MSRFAGARLINELSRSRTSSPRDEAFETASDFDPAREALNSTAQFDNPTTQQAIPLDHNDYHLPGASENDDSSMSIELGRGVKSSARNANEDISSEFKFSLGNDSQYEVMGTPPIRPRPSARKSDGTLRKEASMRAAAAKTGDTPRRSISGLKHRTLSEAMAKVSAESNSSFIGEAPSESAATKARSSRFRKTSANETTIPTRFTAGQGLDTVQYTPRRPPPKATAQSATYTGNATQQSFMLPDLPNITELVSGTWNDGTPVFSRTSRSRSRFTSGSYRAAPPNRPDHLPLESIPIPEDEKAIFASLSLLKDKVAQLESQKAEATKRAEEYEGEIIELKSQLQMSERLHRPDSGLGSDSEGAGQQKWRMEKTKLQASVKALQDRLDRSERKLSVSEIAVKRVTKERDDLVTQLGVAYYNAEKLKAENEALRAGREENEDLKEEVEVLREENHDLRIQLAQFKAQRNEETAQWSNREKELKDRLKRREDDVREMRDMTKDIFEMRKASSPTKESAVKSKKERRASQQGDVEDRSEKRNFSGRLGQDTKHDIAEKIEQEVMRCRIEAAAAKSKQSANEQSRLHRQSSTRSRSKSGTRQQSASAQRHASASRRAFSAPVESDVSEAESTTDLDMSQRTRNTLKKMHLPNPERKVEEEDTGDVTLLSFLDTKEIAKLRTKLELERRQRNVSAPVSKETLETVRSQTAQPVPRKSSLKDIAAGFDNGTGRLSLHADDEGTSKAKAVRIQSPHTSDASLLPRQTDTEDVSMVSNTSRRRRRTHSVEGMTSAFIIPDITIHSQAVPVTGKASIQHDRGNCTACPPGKIEIDIPVPIRVTDRPASVDVTDATIRPAQPPSLALATVLKQLEDEISHLKIQLSAYETLYNQHDPALSKRKRQNVKAKIETLMKEIEKRSDQVYALYDVLEEQKADDRENMGEEQIEETLMSIGIDPAELKRNQQRSMGLDGAVSGDESEGLPWEGLSDVESELSEPEARKQRRRSVVV